MSVATRLFEFLAPHDEEDGPDERGFWERAAFADLSRVDSGGSASWSNFQKRSGHEGRYWDLVYVWQLTQWALSLEVSYEPVTRFLDGRFSVSASLGPFHWALSRITPRLESRGW